MYVFTRREIISRRVYYLYTVRLQTLRQASRVRDNARVRLSDERGVALIFRPLFTSTSLREYQDRYTLRGSCPAVGADG